MKLSERAKRAGNDAPLLNLPLSISSQRPVARWVALGQADTIYGKWDGDLSRINPSQTSATWSTSRRYEIVVNGALEAPFSVPQISNLNDWLIPNVASSERVNVLSVGADFVI